MQFRKKSILLSTITALVLSFTYCGPSKKTQELMKQAQATFGPTKAKMPGAENDTPDRIELGKKLYFDKRLSINDTQSCNSCHIVDNNGAGVDNKPTSPGAKEGTLGNRNSPTVFNAGFHFAQFWDGRAKDLKEQAKGPILNPVEMGMPTEKSVLDKLAKTGEYTDLFNGAFADSKPAMTYDNLAEAIAAFERTLITTDRFDDFMKGDHKALTEAEQKGLDTFIKTGCITCHTGPQLGGHMYQKMGLVKPYANTKDLGRYEVTKEERDKFMFKVPSLRNVALTAPYFHDGAVATLEEAVEQMAWLQLGRKLEKTDIDSIVTFLKALNGKRFAKKST